MAAVPCGETGVGKMMSTCETVVQSGVMDIAISFMPVTANQHKGKGGCCTYYPDPHCTNDACEVHDPGHEEHPHLGDSRPAERFEKTEQSSFDNATMACTIADSDMVCMPETDRYLEFVYMLGNMFCHIGQAVGWPMPCFWWWITRLLCEKLSSPQVVGLGRDKSWLVSCRNLTYLPNIITQEHTLKQ